MRTTSQPINIETSSPDRYNHNRHIIGSTDEHNQDSSSDGEDLHHNEDAHINTNLSDNYSLMTVGSLPSSRRERRLMANHGNNEHFRHGASVSSTRNTGNFRAYRGTGGNSLSRSVPVPQAPFLDSRRDRDTGERLSSIPIIQLPESVTDTLKASSSPYGSLNESQFRSPSSLVNNQRSSKNVASSHNPSSGSGQMLDIHKKVQEMRKAGALIKNDQGGLASLFGGGNAAKSDNEDLDENRTHAISNDHQNSHMQLGMNGIGSSLIGSSLIEESALTQRMQQQQSQKRSTTHGQTSTSIQSPLVSHKLDESHTSGVCESELSSSLTGLSILELSPRGMVDLEPEQREAMASMRSRSFIEDESIFLRINEEGIAPIPEISTADPSFRGLESEQPFSAYSGQSNRSDNEQEGNGDGYFEDAILGVQYNACEEADELFNLDM